MDEDILQDFLVEAGEIFENLNEQLLDLEQNPEDMNLLNAVFRGFHTIKGGAGFLGVTALIELCHRAENLFDKIRNGDRQYDGENVDIVLQAYDAIGGMIQSLSSGERDITSADPTLLAKLDAAVKGTLAPAPVVESASSSSGSGKLSLPDGVDPDGEITDEEFEALLKQRSQKSAPAPAKSAVELDPDGEITDEEFDAMLKALKSGKSAQEAAVEAAVKAGAVAVAPTSAPTSAPTAAPEKAKSESSAKSAAKPAAKK